MSCLKKYVKQHFTVTKYNSFSYLKFVWEAKQIESGTKLNRLHINRAELKVSVAYFVESNVEFYYAEFLQIIIVEGRKVATKFTHSPPVV